MEPDFENITDEEFNNLLEQHYLNQHPLTTMTGSQRRAHFGLGVSSLNAPSSSIFCPDAISGDSSAFKLVLGIYVDSCSTSSKISSPILSKLHPDEIYRRDDVYRLLDRAKAFLTKRTILDPNLAKKIDRRLKSPEDSGGVVSKENPILLSEMFHSLMYSMSSRLKHSSDDTFNISRISNSEFENSKAFVSNVARSNNRWIDPVEQRRLALKDRARLQRTIAYAYTNGLVPILLTFTMQHHWHNLDELRTVLREARSKMFRGRAGLKLAELIGLHHYVDVFEVTITEDGGFHPHCHTLLFIERDKVGLLDEFFAPLIQTSESLNSQSLDFTDSVASTYTTVTTTATDATATTTIASIANADSCTPKPRDAASTRDVSAFRFSSDSGAQKTCENNSQLDHVENYYHLLNNDQRYQFIFDKQSSLRISPSERDELAKNHINPIEYMLKKRWLSLLAASVKKHFGEVEFNNSESSYKDALFTHALVLSRYKKGKNKGKVIRCKDGEYLAKILGVVEEKQQSLHFDDSNSSNEKNTPFGVDSELTAASYKDSMIPFDLLRKVSAHNIDMWAEYAISTKGWHKIRFSQGLQEKVDTFFKNHPKKDPQAPKSDLTFEDVLKLDDASYYYFLNSNLIPTLLEKAAKGADVAADWISHHEGINVTFSKPPKPKPPD